MASAPGAANPDRPTSAPPPAETSRIGHLRPSPLVTSISAANSAVSSPAIRTQIGPTSKSKGLQLGANKVPASVIAAALADEWIDETAENNDSNPWGTDDLIDVNADQDDWSEIFAQSFTMLC